MKNDYTGDPVVTVLPFFMKTVDKMFLFLKKSLPKGF